MFKRLMAATGVTFVLVLGSGGAALAASPTSTSAHHHVDFGKKHQKPHKKSGGGW